MTSPDTVINAVCVAHAIDRPTLFARHGKRATGEARMMLYMLWRVCCRLDMGDMAKLANVDYGVVHYGMRAFRNHYDVDKKTRATFHNILNHLAA